MPGLERQSDSYHSNPYTVIELVEEPPLEEVDTADAAFFQNDPEA